MVYSNPLSATSARTLKHALNLGESHAASGFRRRSIGAIAVLLSTVLWAHPLLALQGTVYRDYDGDSVRDALEPLVAGVTVSAFGNNNTLCGTTITSAAGTTPNFSFTPAIAPADCNVATYRVEFTTLPVDSSGLPSTGGVNSGVQFLAGGATGVLHGIRTGAEYCVVDPSNTSTLRVATSRQFITNEASLLDPTLIDFPYDNTGDPNRPSHVTAAIESETGAVYGLAWQRTTRSLYAGAQMRRHVESLGLGRIYRVRRNAANNGWLSGVQVYADLQSLFPGAGGVDPRPVTGHNFESDTSIWDQVGKMGLGDLQLSENDQVLYAVALGDRRLYQIPADSPTPITNASQITGTSIPRPASCAVDSDFRPYGLGNADGEIFVGAVCTGQSSATAGNACRVNGDRSLLRGYVLRFRPGVGFDAQPVLDFPLNYPRLDVDPPGGCLPDDDPVTPGTQTLGNARWNVWSGAQLDTPFQANGQVYPQPMLVDIAFDRGDMIIGLRDRLTDQGSDGTVGPPAQGNAITGGEFLRACKQANGSFQLESNGSCTGINGAVTGIAGTSSNGARGPGTGGLGGEFYAMDTYTNDTSNPPTSTQPTTFDGATHDEVGAGALLQVPGNGFVMGTAFDPWTDFGTGGIRRFSNTSPSTPASGYEIYDGTDALGFYKATALGDIEGLCDVAPLIIGNRIYVDSNNNGRQDPTEAGRAGEPIELYSASGVLLGRTVSDANGNYAFQMVQIFTGSDANTGDNIVQLPSSLLYGTTLYVSLRAGITAALMAPADAAAAGPGAAGTAELGLGDERDSDGVATSIPGVGSRIAATVTLFPTVNKSSIDFGVLGNEDFGDLPDTSGGIGTGNYQTLLANNGPRHTIVGNLFLGSTVDGETNGVSSSSANADDLAVSDDEDAVPAGQLNALAGSTRVMTIGLNNTQGSAARLCVFTDWTNDGDFADASETQFFSVPNGASSLGIGLSVPAIGGSVAVGAKYQRYRLFPSGASCVAADADGAATAGEVEDYVFSLGAAAAGSDFGDLPNGTYLSSGAGAASHTLSATLYLGASVPDSEATGFPSAAADGDDTNGVDDEDSIPSGLLFIENDVATALPVTLVNNTGATARLCAYVDYNADGDFGDANEGPVGGASGIAVSASASPQIVSVSLAANASTGNARLRVRLTDAAACDFNNALGAGELEDYILTQITTRDFGDHPDDGTATLGTDNYNVVLSNGGAFHGINNNLRLGAIVDAEANGQPSPLLSNGNPPRADDLSVSDDEDGVSESSLFVPLGGGTVAIPVNVTNLTGGAATLCSFFDVGDNGIFADGGDVTVTTSIPTGTNGPVIIAPTFAAGGGLSTYARFRLQPGTIGCDTAASTGGRTLGEVEDYRFYRAEVDFGDAPDTLSGTASGDYQTTAQDNGPMHRVFSGLGLGAVVDIDSGTNQNANATADDLTLVADEDSVSSGLSVATGATINLTVAVRNNGTSSRGGSAGLCGFLDLNGDGDFNDAGESVFSTVAVGDTSEAISFGTAPASPITTVLRLRLSTDYANLAACQSAGAADDGEVEDYRFVVGSLGDFGDLPSGYNTGGAARHAIVPGLYFGDVAPDAEAAPAASTNADGDNLAGVNDEDGIVDSLLVAVTGNTLTLPIGVTNATAAAAGVCAYADLDGNGSFGAGEGPVYSALAAASGTQVVWAAFGTVTDNASPVYLRIRVSNDYTSAGACSSNTVAGSGEVEDYALTLISQQDYGDLNTAAITQNPNGARHGIIVPLRLGAVVDSETNGVLSANADGDDTAGVPDDEDGITVSALRAAPTQTATIPVTLFNFTGASVRLCTFFDANNNGSFADAGDVIVTQGVSNGAVSAMVALTVPGGTTAGSKRIRFRLGPANPAVACTAAEGAGGVAAGEVEDYLFQVGPFDYGDAPDTGAGTGTGNYNTTAADNGPNHVLNSLLFLGAVAADGDDGTLQSVNALADDSALTPDDEDGTTALSVAPSTAISIPVTVTNNTAGTVGLCAMLDINSDGVFANSSAERTFQTRAVGTTATAVSMGTAPASPISTYLRLRVSSAFTDAASCDVINAIDGEIEDFRFEVATRDFGDLPNVASGLLPAYTTTVDGGSATLATGVSFGAAPVDVESAIQPSALANGDDLAGGDDEDGLGAVTLALTGSTVLPVDIRNSSGANVDACAFVDWNRDGDFIDTNERVISDEITSAAGDRGDITVTAPAGVTAGPIALRLMIMSETGSISTECDSDAAEAGGEVEDYILTAGNPDFGDAPDSYGTLAASNGARHAATANGGGTTLRLGSDNPDTETNGVPGVNANGDDTAGTDDENSVVDAAGSPTVPPTLVQGSASYSLRIEATNDINASAGICAYLDVNGNGIFESSEVQYTTIADDITDGLALLTWPLTFQEIPQGNTYLRVRISTAFASGVGSCSPTGAAPNGEVEDFAVAVQARDFGDLPDAGTGIGASAGGNPPNYRTTLADNGPRHTISNSLRLGTVVDGDLDGVSSLSTADDVLDAIDDEAGLESITRITPNVSLQTITATVRVTNTTGNNARVCVFVDRNADGDFADSGEIGSAVVVTGSNNSALAVNIPAPSGQPSQPAGTPGIGIRVRLAPDANPGFAADGTAGCQAADADGPMIASGDPAIGEVEDYYTGAPNTVPVTLVAVSALRSAEGAVQVRFGTASEAGTLGYNVYAGTQESEARTLLNSSLVVARSNGLISGDYEAVGLAPQATMVWIEELDVLGKQTLYGPYAIGSVSGDFDVARPIAWQAVNSERQAFAQTRRGAGEMLSARVGVTQTGWHEISGQRLLELVPSFAGASTAQLRLTRFDGDVAQLLVQSADAVLSADDVIGFYGVAATSRYTAIASYELTRAAGRAIGQQPATAAASGVGELRDRFEFRRNKLYGMEIPGNDPWYAARVIRNTAQPAVLEERFVMANYAPSAGERITVHLLGGLDFAGDAPDHSVALSLNGHRLGHVRFDGITAHDASFPLPANVLRDGENVLSVSLLPDTGYSVDRVNLEGLTVQANRLLRVQERVDLQLNSNPDCLFHDRFELVNAGGVSAPVSVAISDVTAGTRFFHRRGASLTQLVDVKPTAGVARLTINASAGDALVVSKQPLVPTLSGLPALADPIGNQAIDLLIISDAQFAPAMEPLVAARINEGLRVKLVHSQDVMRYYAAGMFGPEGVARAIRAARREAGVKYVLLVGGDTYDYFNYAGLDSVSFIPTLYGRTGAYVQHAPLDALFGDTNNDGVIDVAIGRFPVRTLAETEAMVAKTLSYATAGHAQRVIAVSDRTQQGYDYASQVRQWHALLPGNWQRQELAMDQFSNDAVGLSEARSALYLGLTAGQAITTYYGHSAPGAWTRNGLVTQSYLAANPVGNPARPTAVLQWGCWGTYFVEPSANTVAHGLLTLPGGAAIVVGASALTETTSDEVLAKTLMPQLAQPGVRFGDALLAAQAEMQLLSPEALDVLLGTTILGDPSLRMAQ